MPMNYNKLWKLMIDKNLSKTELTHLAGISTNAMAKLGRNEDVRVNVLENFALRWIANWTILSSLKQSEKNNPNRKGVTVCCTVPSSMCMTWTSRLRMR